MSDIPRILIPVDGSEHARNAIAHALSMTAANPAAEIHLLNVQPPVRGAAASLVAQSDLESYHREEGMTVLADAAKTVEAGGKRPPLHVGVGDPGETVLAFAKRLACTQIVMGTRGLGGVGAFLLGSVARDVAGSADIPVTVIR